MLLELLSSRQVVNARRCRRHRRFFAFLQIQLGSHSAVGRQNDPFFRRIPCAERQAQRELGRGFPSCVTPSLAGRDHVAGLVVAKFDQEVEYRPYFARFGSGATELRSDGRF